MFLRIMAVVVLTFFSRQVFGLQYVLTAPTGNQTVTQPQASTLNVNSLNNVVNAAQLNWSQAVSIGAGGTSVTLNPCPLGVNGSNPNYYIYLSGGSNPGRRRRSPVEPALAVPAEAGL